MIFDFIQIWTLEVNDVVSLNVDENLFTVTAFDDSDEGKIAVELRDEDGERETFYFTPTDTIALFTGLDD